MPPLIDPEKLTCYRNALANWRYEGFIALTDVAFEWMSLNLPSLTPRLLGEVMYEYVEDGGEIDQQKERRPEWNFHEYHYDLRVPIEGRVIYIETRLICDDPDDPDNPVIHVVNVHEA